MRHQLLTGALRLRWTGEGKTHTHTHTHTDMHTQGPGNEYVNHMMATSIPVSDLNLTL